MDDAKVTEISQWLVKALNDLESAKLLAFGDKWIGDTSVYHCQQAAEKSLKAYLVLNDRPIQKIHDLTVILSQCEVIDTQFSELLEACEILTPYATLFRYPGAQINPERSDVEEAVVLATKIFEFVFDRMSADIQTEVRA